MRHVSPQCLAPSPFGQGNLPIPTTAPAFSAASISSSSVRRCNNLIPYSRGGCRPWRIEWNKIKPRIPRVLWRGSFPIQPQSRIPTSTACARVYIPWAPASSFSFCSCPVPHPLFSPHLFSALHFCMIFDCPFADASLVSSYISGLLCYWELMVFLWRTVTGSNRIKFNSCSSYLSLLGPYHVARMLQLYQTLCTSFNLGFFPECPEPQFYALQHRLCNANTCSYH